MSAEATDTLVGAVDRLFEHLASAEGPRDTSSLNESAWRRLEEVGVTSLLVPETEGGYGGGWRDLEAVLHSAGFWALSLPIAETILVRGLLGPAGAQVPPGAISFNVTTDASLQCAAEHGPNVFTGTIRDVPWGRNISFVLFDVLAERERLRVLASTEAAFVTASSNIAGEPRDDLKFVNAPVTVINKGNYDLMTLGALIRVFQISGALDYILNLSVRYVLERKQFGRPLAEFQVIQHQLAVLAEEVAAVRCAAMAAASAAESGFASFEIAAAKLRANLAVSHSTSIAHQCHGAIGLTEEYSLQRATRRLWAWRSEFGNDRYWSEWLGIEALNLRSLTIWQAITDRDGDRVSPS